MRKWCLFTLRVGTSGSTSGSLWKAINYGQSRVTLNASSRAQKKKRQLHPQPIYRPGEAVLAKWTDCKKYPAKISRLIADNTYEVTFYDGLTRQIQAINIHSLPEEMINQKSLLKTAPTPKVKSAFKNIKLKLPESVTRRLKSTSGYKMNKLSTGRLHKKKHSPIRAGMGSKHPSHLGDSSRDCEATDNAFVQLSPLKMKPTPLKMKPSPLTTKPSPLTTKPSPLTTKPSPLATKPSPLMTKPSPLKMIPPPLNMKPSPLNMKPSPQRPVQVSIVERPSFSDDGAVSTAGRLPSAGPDVKATTDQRTVAVEQPAMAVQEPNPCHLPTKIVPAKRTKSHFGPGTVLDMKTRHKRSKFKSMSGVPSPRKRPYVRHISRPISLDTTAELGITPIPLSYGYVLMPFTPSKAFIVEEDHNPFKCPQPDCHKDFRKETLLISHIKYYHPELEPSASSTTCTATAPSTSSVTASLSVTTATTVATASSSSSIASVPLSLTPSVQSPQARKRRRKTSSICSTDSDISVSSKGKSSSKRIRHLSELSVPGASPEFSVKDIWGDERGASSQAWTSDDVTGGGGETEEEEVERDVVNCVCGVLETSGLMIQCDVCMCWQHFACVDTKGSSEPPINYVCKVCENTPGVRDSCRNLHDMGWERRGELPAFPYVSGGGEQLVCDMACECNDLLTSLHSLKSALHSTRRHIKISKEENNQEFQLWQTDWDNWTKPEDDLLTPRSVTTDPAPSPTPSAFLFPPHPSVQCGASSTSSTAEVSMTRGEASTISPSMTTIALDSVAAPLDTSSSAATMGGKPITSTTTPSARSSFSAQQMSNNLTIGSSYHAVTATESIGIVSDSSASSSTSLHSVLPSCQNNMSTSRTTPVATSASKLSKSNVTVASPSSAENNSNCVSHGQISVQVDAQQQASMDEDAISPPVSRPLPDPPMTPATLRMVTRLPMVTGNNSDITCQLFLGPGRDVSSPHSTQQRTAGGIGDTQQQHRLPAPEFESPQQVRAITSTPRPHSPPSCNGQQNQAQGDRDVEDKRKEEETTAQVTERRKEGRIEEELRQRTSSPIPDGNEEMNGLEDADRDDNDTDTAEESCDPYRNCEHNLLVHVTQVHTEIERQLEALERQVIELEHCDQRDPTVQLCEENVLNDVPALKKSLTSLANSLDKVHRLATCH